MNTLGKGHKMEEIRKFAETTSMKGVPRIMKAKALPVRILWIASLLGLLCLSVFICFQLISQYLSFDTAIRIRDLNSFGDDYQNYSEVFALPAITVCNQNPLTAYNGYEGTSWAEYSFSVNELLKDADPFIRGRYLSPRGYLEYIGAQAVVSNTGEHPFVVDCALGLRLNNGRFQCNYTLTHFPNVLYSQCFTVNLLGLEDYPYYPTTLSLTLYLDEVNAPMTNYVAETRATSGAVVLIHGPGQMPIFEDAEFAPPGTLTTIKVRQSMFQRLEDSADPCSDATNEIHIQSLSGVLHNYSQLGCIADLFQTKYLQECGCIDSNLLVLPRNKTAAEVIFCGVSANETQAALEIRCIGEIIVNATVVEDAVKICTPLCKELTHMVTTTSSPWPTETSQLSFYSEIIDGSSFANHFEVYRDILYEFLTTLDSQKSLKRLKQETLIKENFAKIEIVLPALRADLFSVSYQMSLPSLAASLGGNLNLWSGISVIIIVELFDLCLKLILSASNHSTKVTRVNVGK